MKHIKKDFKVGDYYIDCGYIPRVVVKIDYEIRYIGKVTPENYEKCQKRLFKEGLVGRSLIDGSIGSCSIRHCAPEWVHKGVAERWAKYGPISQSLKEYLKAFYAGEWGAGRKIWWKE